MNLCLIIGSTTGLEIWIFFTGNATPMREVQSDTSTGNRQEITITLQGARRLPGMLDETCVVNDALLIFWLDPELCLPTIDAGAIAFGNRQQPIPRDIASDWQRAFRQRIRLPAGSPAAAKARGIRLG